MLDLARLAGTDETPKDCAETILSRIAAWAGLLVVLLSLSLPACYWLLGHALPPD